MSKLELFEKIEPFLRVYPEMKDRFIPLEDLAIQAIDEQIELYDLPKECIMR